MQKLKDTAVLSTAYMPNIQYISKIVLHKEVVIDVHETYLKQSYRNRCEVASANGKLDLSIPILKPNGNRTKTRDIQIDYTTNWQKIHWRAIVSAYSSSPFFEIFEKELAPLYSLKDTLLVDFNTKVLTKLFECIGHTVSLSYSNSYISEDKFTFDFRNSLSPKKRLQRPDNNFKPAPYYQVFQQKHGFLANLSFLDLIMNEGPAALSIIKRSTSTPN